MKSFEVLFQREKQIGVSKKIFTSSLELSTLNINIGKTVKSIAL